MKTLFFGSLAILTLLVTLNVSAAQIVIFPVLNCNGNSTYLNVELLVGSDSKFTVKELQRIACINIDQLEHEDNKRGRQ